MEQSLLVSLIVSMSICYAAGQWPICGADFCDDDEFCRPHKITGEDTCFRCDNFESMCFTTKHESNCTSWCTAAMMKHTKERDCTGKPPEILNGNYSLASLNTLSYQQGTKAEYSCSDGYYINGRKHVTCKEFGQWSDPPICEAVTCRIPKAPTNGHLHINSSTVTEKKSLRIGEILSYTCDAGYQLIGETHSNCTDDGQLDHQPPVCNEGNSEKGFRITTFCLIAVIVAQAITNAILYCKWRNSSKLNEDIRLKSAEEEEALLNHSSGQFNSDTTKTVAEPTPQPQSNGVNVGNRQPATIKFSAETARKKLDKSLSGSDDSLSNSNNTPGSNNNSNGYTQSNGSGIAINNNNNNNSSANPTVNINLYMSGSNQPFEADQMAAEPEINGVGIQEEGENANTQPKSSDIQVPAQPLPPKHQAQPSERFHPHSSDEGEKAIDNVNAALHSAGQELSSILSNHQQEQQRGPSKITVASGEADQQDLGI